VKGKKRDLEEKMLNLFTEPQPNGNFCFSFQIKTGIWGDLFANFPHIAA
jgi:hypothetical protein